MSDAAGTSTGGEMTFWDHAEALRGTVLRAAAIVGTMTVVLFLAMPRLFDSVILAPCRPGFALYRLYDAIASLTGSAGDTAWQGVELVNIQLASQFFIHINISFWLGLALSFPAVIYLLWRFVAPGLYPRERQGARTAFLLGNVMFFLGVAVGYYVVFPLTLRFLADYRVSDAVPNHISLDSYMDNFVTIILIMGVIFEMPLLAWMLGKAGVVTRELFRRYTRHAIVGLLILAAVVTPTGDPFTLMVVFLPLMGLWQLSAALVKPARQPQPILE